MKFLQLKQQQHCSRSEQRRQQRNGSCRRSIRLGWLLLLVLLLLHLLLLGCGQGGCRRSSWQ
jgi:hypothetical protein